MNYNIDKEKFIRICENSKTMSEASRKLNLHFNTFKRYALKFNCYIPNQGGKDTNKIASNKFSTKDILEGKYPDYQPNKLKIRLLNEGYKEYKCEYCGLSKWNNLPIPLELHHIDGNRHNNKLENLKILCPNCHSQTETFRGKNIKY